MRRGSPRRITAWILAVCAWIVYGGCRTALAAEPPRKAPDPKEASRKVQEWKSAGGLEYAWRGPRKYDPAKGVGLTLILHGSNLSHSWGFANHPPETFRPDDLVVCPDGTTPNGSGGFNFLDAPADVEKLGALLTELKAAYKIRATYLYGHSQGSFFALKYAAEKPAEIDGVVAHASGLWASSPIGASGHHQAIVLMHGTLDPVVPYSQSVGAYEAYRKAAYPMVRLRSLESWNHWPAEANGPVAHTSQQLAWVEGMTTRDPARLAECFSLLATVKKKDQHDWSGLYTLSRRLAELPETPDPMKARARKAMSVVETLAKAHAAAISVTPVAAFEKKPWPAHLGMFLRAFPEVPAREELAAAWAPAREAQRTAGAEAWKAYSESAAKPGQEAAAFAKGVQLLQTTWLIRLNTDGSLQQQLAAWEKEGRKFKLEREALKDFGNLNEVVKTGGLAFAAINNKAQAP